MMLHVFRSRRRIAQVAPITLMFWLMSSAGAFAQAPEPEDPETTAQQPIPAPTRPPVEVVEAGAFTLTPFLGFSFGGQLENTPLNVGLAAAYNWTPRVSFEGELGYLRRGTRGFPDPLDTSVLSGVVNVLYHFAAETNLAPYGTIGIGFGRGSVELAPGLTERDTELVVNAGGGVQTRIADRANLRAGLRYFNGADLVPNFWRPYVGLTLTLGEVR